MRPRSWPLLGALLATVCCNGRRCGGSDGGAPDVEVAAATVSPDDPAAAPVREALARIGPARVLSRDGLGFRVEMTLDLTPELTVRDVAFVDGDLEVGGRRLDVGREFLLGPKLRKQEVSESNGKTMIESFPYLGPTIVLVTGRAASSHSDWFWRYSHMGPDASVRVTVNGVPPERPDPLRLVGVALPYEQALVRAPQLGRPLVKDYLCVGYPSCDAALATFTFVVVDDRASD